MCLFRLADSRRFTTFYPAPGTWWMDAWMAVSAGRPERGVHPLPRASATQFSWRWVAAFDGHGGRALASPWPCVAYPFRTCGARSVHIYYSYMNTITTPAPRETCGRGRGHEAVNDVRRPHPPPDARPGFCPFRDVRVRVQLQRG